MSEVILERELKYYEKSTGEKISSIVKIYPSRLVIKSSNKTKSILIRYINAVEFYEYPAWGYLIAGIAFFFIFLIIYLIPDNLKTPAIFFLESPFEEILIALSLIFSFILITAWYYLRSFILSINSFGYTLQLYSKDETPIKEVFETLERIREETQSK